MLNAVSRWRERHSSHMFYWQKSRERIHNMDSQRKPSNDSVGARNAVDSFVSLLHAG